MVGFQSEMLSSTQVLINVLQTRNSRYFLMVLCFRCFIVADIGSSKLLTNAQ